MKKTTLTAISLTETLYIMNTRFANSFTDEEREELETQIMMECDRDDELERCAFGNVLVNPWTDVIGNIHCKCDECLAEDERIARIESPNDFIDEPTSYYDDEEDVDEWDDDYDEAYFDDCEDDDMED